MTIASLQAIGFLLVHRSVMHLPTQLRDRLSTGAPTATLPRGPSGKRADALSIPVTQGVTPTNSWPPYSD